MRQINQVPLALSTDERITKKKGIIYYLKKFLKPDKAKIIISIMIGISYSIFLWYIFSQGYCQGEAGFGCIIYLFLIANFFLTLSMIMPDSVKAIVLFFGAGLTIYIYSCIIVLIYRFFKGKK